MHKAVKLTVRGRVQGVGFRPFVFQLAQQYKLKGYVQNNMDGVRIHIEGMPSSIEYFLKDLVQKKPRLSKINEFLKERTSVENYHDFKIVPSERSGKSMLVIPIDSAICENCLDEMNDTGNFRYQYPFINCTDCGPRYTIIEELPYDRPYTSMQTFHMCSNCLQEYHDPRNRRHHAQPIACPTCGPQVSLFNGEGRKITIINPLEEVIEKLISGWIVAIKGIGGYHLCCDARNEKAVERLRNKKNRPNRPLAIMSSSLKEIKSYAKVTGEEEFVLQSPEAPIVVLEKKKESYLAESIAPGMKTIGVMLPYTPLHHLLFQTTNLPSIVMTSANPSGLPILYQDREAFHFLNGMADYVLTHNREILHPVDDSVIQLAGSRIDFIRRSRGFVPEPIWSNDNVTGIVAFGGQQKSTFTIGRENQIFIGPHIGDLENVETIDHFKRELDHLLKWVEIPLKTAVIDYHPHFMNRELVKEYPFQNIIEVQHHHAHMAACMGEHQLEDEVYGIILDGTGYGLDGNVWGFEILYGNYSRFNRLAHLEYTPLAGGEKAIKEPWRNAVGMLYQTLGEEGLQYSSVLFRDRLKEMTVLKAMIDKNVNTIMAGSCGRLFDAVSAICGVCLHSTYDGEAAIKLSELAHSSEEIVPYSYEMTKINELYTFETGKMLSEIVKDVLSGVEVKLISTRFHETIVQAIVSMMLKIQEQAGSINRKVVLSGGSMHNRYLSQRLSLLLKKNGFEVYLHHQVPCNDGGLSYGQLLVAAAQGRS